MDKYLPVVGRIMLAQIFLLTGISKIGAYAGTQAYMHSAGVPGGLLPLVILVEIVGGLAPVYHAAAFRCRLCGPLQV